MKTIILLFFSVILTACGSRTEPISRTVPAPAPSVSPSQTVPLPTPTVTEALPFGYTDLMGMLRSSGVQVQVSGDVTIPFFSVQGHLIRVNDDEVQVFEFDDPNTASAQLAALESIRQSSTRGTISPYEFTHIYKKGRIIVVYRGDDRNVKNVLENILGSQLDGG